MDGRVEVTDLCKVRRKQRVLEEVSFAIAPGRITGLLGRNGAGKTTLFHCLIGLLQPQSGVVLVSGGSPRDPRILATIGYMPETIRLYPFLTVRQTLCHYGRLSGLRDPDLEQRVHGLLRELALEPFSNHRNAHLSKGTAQRVGIAQALLHSPRLLLLDEPLDGLDPLQREALFDSLRRRAREGMTIVVSTHSIPDVEQLCDDVLILHSGKIAYQGTVRRHTEIETLGQVFSRVCGAST